LQRYRASPEWWTQLTGAGDSAIRGTRTTVLGDASNCPRPNFIAAARGYLTGDEVAFQLADLAGVRRRSHREWVKETLDART